MSGSTFRNYTTVVGLSVCVTLAVIQGAVSADEATQETNQRIARALTGSLVTSVGHGREWLEAGDFKSLLQAAGGLQMLAEMLQARSDDADWHTEVGKLTVSIGELRAAARAEDRQKCGLALNGVELISKLTSSGPRAGTPVAAPRSQGGVRPLMLLMDGIRGDAKIALLRGQPGNAKQAAMVMSELGRAVAASRAPAGSEGDWSRLSDDFIQATMSLASSSAEDGPTLRRLLREVSQKCDTCHDKR